MATDNLGALQTATSITATGTVAATAIDLKNGAPLPVTLWGNGRLTAIGGTSPTFAVKLQGSSDNTTFVDILAAQTLTAVGTFNLPIKTNYRYVRMHSTWAGTSPTGTFDCYISTTPINPEG